MALRVRAARASGSSAQATQVFLGYPFGVSRSDPMLTRGSTRCNNLRAVREAVLSLDQRHEGSDLLGGVVHHRQLYAPGLREVFAERNKLAIHPFEVFQCRLRDFLKAVYDSFVRVANDLVPKCLQF